MKHTIIFIFALFASFGLYGQQKEYQGLVINTDRTPVIGANVRLVGTLRGAATDSDGKFSIRAKEGDKLKVSFVGMVRQTVTLPEHSKIAVILETEREVLEEVTINAVRRVQPLMGYFVTQGYSADEHGGARSLGSRSNIEGLLQGRVAGLAFDSEGNIRIRGGSMAKIYVDNVQWSNEEVKTINPDDIQFIHVAKDPSAAVMLGFGAMDGIVFITTKQAYHWALNDKKYRANKRIYNVLLKEEIKRQKEMGEN